MTFHHHCMKYPCPVCMGVAKTTTNGTFTGSWNGGVCTVCRANYVGTHSCSRGDILRRIADLNDMLDRLGTATPATQDRMAGCPCRPENGGSGVCGCVLSGPTITC